MKFSLDALARMGINLQVVKTSLAAGISWLVASLLPHSPYPIFAPLAAILIMQVTIANSIEKALYRILGVIGGVCVGVLVGYFFTVGTISITLVVLLGMAVSTAFRLNPQVTSQVAVSALLVLDYGRMQGYVVGRIGETVVGSVVAVVINILICPPKSSPAVRQQIRQLTKNLAEVLQNMQISSQAEQTLMSARTLVIQTEKTYQSLTLALQNLQFTPFWSHERLLIEDLLRVMSGLEHMATQVRGIARGFFDLHEMEDVHFDFFHVLVATAECIELFGVATANPSVESIQKLKQTIVKARNIQARCFSEHQQVGLSALREIGGIFTDLGRILDEVERIVGENYMQIPIDANG